MDISIFLAKVMGLYLFILSIAFFVNTKSIKTIAHDIVHNPGLFFISNIMTLILGILLVVSHNIWQGDWTIVITLLAWIVFIKGMIRVVFPSATIGLIDKMIENQTTFYVTAAISGLIGLFLLYFGFQS